MYIPNDAHHKKSRHHFILVCTCVCVCVCVCLMYVFVIIPSPHTCTYGLLVSCVSEIREQMKLVEKGVAQKEPRFINRAIRNLHSLRRKTNDTVLRAVVMAYYPPGGWGGMGCHMITLVLGGGGGEG